MNYGQRFSIVGIDSVNLALTYVILVVTIPVYLWLNWGNVHSQTGFQMLYSLSVNLPQLKTIPITSDPGLTKALIAISKRMRALMGIKLSALGLHSGQDEYLLALNHNIPQSVSSIAQVLAVKSSTCSKMTDRLFKAGYIERHPNMKDRRTVFVSITTNGLEMRSQVLELHQRIEVELTSSFDAQIRECLEITDDVLCRLLARLR